MVWPVIVIAVFGVVFSYLMLEIFHVSELDRKSLKKFKEQNKRRIIL